MKLPGAFLRSPLIRIFVYAVLAAAVAAVTVAVTVLSRETPIITALYPPVASPGEVLTIEGKGFGKERKESAVLIGSNRVTSSHYLSWSPTQIRFTLPANGVDGIVVVETAGGVSKPQIFTNAENVPVVLKAQIREDTPLIQSLSRETVQPCSVLTIRGAHFGSVTAESAVLFTSAYEPGGAEIPFAEASEKTGDLDSWTEGEIRVFVPEAAASGVVIVRNRWGKSNSLPLFISTPLGKKTFTRSRVYVVSFDTDINQVTVARQNASLFLRVPRPALSPIQPAIILEASKPLPVNPDYNNMLIHHIQLEGVKEKKVFYHTFVVTVFGVTTEITGVPEAYSPQSRVRFQGALNPREAYLEEEDTDGARAAAETAEILGSEKNPYLQARLLFDAVVSETNDPYAAALKWTKLARTAGIIAQPVAGIAVDGLKLARPHWWGEFFLEHFGWVPVDFETQAFGTLDAGRIAFSRGWRSVKSAFPNGHVVYRPRTFAFQSIWEESSVGTDSYSSFWSDPVVTGVY